MAHAGSLSDVVVSAGTGQLGAEPSRSRRPTWGSGVQLHVAVGGAKRHLLVHGLLQPGKLFLDESRLVDGVNDGAARHDIGRGARGRLVGIP